MGAPDAASRLALGIARALARPDLRLQILQDMRDSPFPKHRIHLASYLRGRRGASVVAAAANSVGITPAEYLAVLEGLPELELHMERPYDRALWKGTADVAVVGITRSFEEIYAAAGAAAQVPVLSVDGSARLVRLDEYFGPPLLFVKPAQVNFGSDVEERRTRAPQRSGNAISSKMEEATVATMSCDPETAIVPCDTKTGSSGGYNPVGYRLGHTFQACVNPTGGSDADQDGILDACEAEIAHAFRPGLRFDVGERWYSRDTFWSVRRSNLHPNALSVFYLLGYHRDNGDPTFFGLIPHDGDSEFIGIAVTDMSGDGRWGLEEVTYSAHWHKLWDRTDDRAYNDARVEYSDGVYRGRVRSWVGESKHANYARQSVCNTHGDDCFNPQGLDTPVQILDTRNIGNRWAAGIPLFTNPCAASFHSSPFTECFWTDSTFRGWQSEDGSGGGGHRYPLEWYGY